MDINEAGQVVGSSHRAFDHSPHSLGSAFFWSDNLGMIDLGGFPAILPISAAFAINELGQVVGSSAADVFLDPDLYPSSLYPDGVTVHRAFLWQAGVMIDLGDLSGGGCLVNSSRCFSTPYDINDLGQVVGNSDGSRWFLWDDGGMTDLGIVGIPHAINNRSQIAGYRFAGTVHAVIWDNGQLTDLGELDGGRVYSDAFDINDAGQVVGHSLTDVGTGEVSHAILWERQTGIVDLNSKIDPASGWVLHYAYGINNHGQIVGRGTYHGNTRAFLLTLDPPLVPDIVMRSVATPDSRRVVYEYEITKTDITTPFQVGIYRSADPLFDSSDVVLSTHQVNPGEAIDLDGNPAVNLGIHRIEHEVLLRPDPSHPFVLVVADPTNAISELDDSNNTAGFRKAVLGVVTHGFQWSGRFESLEGLEALGRGLTETASYDHTILFDWRIESNDRAPQRAVLAGRRMARQVSTVVAKLAPERADSVDVHFIGHSRGAVVISEAIWHLQKLDERGRLHDALASGYFKMTMLDPHPAHNRHSDGSSTRWFSAQPGRLGKLAEKAVVAFQQRTRDPEIIRHEIVDEAEVYYQNTNHALTSSLSEQVLNLWGEVPIAGQGSLYCNLTGFVHGNGAIGHSGVPIWFRDAVVPLLKANRQFACPDGRIELFS